MNEIIKYVGIILVLAGAAILAVPQFMGTTTNSTLGAGVIVIVLGILVHIVINRNID